jgi:hypothetical protein
MLTLWRNASITPSVARLQTLLASVLFGIDPFVVEKKTRVCAIQNR